MGFYDWYWGERIGTPIVGSDPQTVFSNEKAAGLNLWDYVPNPFNFDVSTLKLVAMGIAFIGAAVLIKQTRGLLR